MLQSIIGLSTRTEPNKRGKSVVKHERDGEYEVE